MAFAILYELFVLKAKGSVEPLVVSKTDKTALEKPQWIRGDEFTLRIHLLGPGDTEFSPLVGEQIDAGDQIVFAGKPAATPEQTDALFSATPFTEVLSGGQYYYEATLDLSADNLKTAIAATGNNQLAVLCDIEIENSDNSRRKTFQFGAIVRAQAYKGTESDPGTGNVLYPAPGALALVTGVPNFYVLITGLTGGGSTKLDGIATTALAAGYLACAKISGNLKFYQLQAGAAGAGDVAPADYDAGTNNKKWVQVL